MKHIFIFSGILLFHSSVYALEISPQNLTAGKTSGVKLLGSSGVDVTKSYSLAYEDSDPAISELSISSFSGSPTIVPVIAGSNYKLVATKIADPAIKENLFINVIPGAPSKLIIVSGNSQSGSVGATMASPLVVKLVDSKGNGISGSAINWSSASGSVSDGSTTTSSDGLSQVSFTNGESVGVSSVTATLSSNSLIKTNFSETAKAPSGAGAANKLAFNSLPASFIYKNEIIPFLVDVKDSLNSTVNSSAVVSISAHSNSSCSASASGVLGGTLSRAAEGGSASFASVSSSLSYNSVGTIYLKASSPGLVSVCSRPLSILERPISPSKLAFIYPPLVSSVQNKAFSPNIKVALQDINGNLYSSDSYPVSLSAYSDSSCSALASSALSGITESSSISGYALFSGISYPDVESLYLKAESSGLSSACSKMVQVSPDLNQVPASLKITQVSTRSEQNKLFSIQPKVSILNSSKGLVTSGSISVTIAAYSDSGCSSPAEVSLSGVLLSSSNSGVASFSGIHHAEVGTIYIKATSESLSSPCSTAISITQPVAGVANKLAFFLQPSASGSANVLLSQQPKVEVQDGLGERVLNANVSVSIGYYSDSSCLTPVLGAASSNIFSSSGIASFSNIKLASAGTYYLKASSGKLKSSCSSSIEVGATSISGANFVAVGEEFSHAILYKNRQKLYLDSINGVNVPRGSKAKFVVGSGNLSCIVGTVENETIRAALWKNEDPVTIFIGRPDEPSFPDAGVIRYNNHCISGGVQMIEGNNRATVWFDDQEIILGQLVNQQSTINSIVISGGNLFAAGTESENYGTDKAALWKVDLTSLSVTKQSLSNLSSVWPSSARKVVATESGNIYAVVEQYQEQPTVFLFNESGNKINLIDGYSMLSELTGIQQSLLNKNLLFFASGENVFIGMTDLQQNRLLYVKYNGTEPVFNYYPENFTNFISADVSNGSLYTVMQMNNPTAPFAFSYYLYKDSLEVQTISDGYSFSLPRSVTVNGSNYLIAEWGYDPVIDNTVTSLRGNAIPGGKILYSNPDGFYGFPFWAKEKNNVNYVFSIEFDNLGSPKLTLWENNVSYKLTDADPFSVIAIRDFGLY